VKGERRTKTNVVCFCYPEPNPILSKDNEMSALNLPTFETKITVSDGKRQIFDTLRRCYVALTPEEWVRQHFVHYLLDHKGYPATLMGNEIAITLNGMNRRCDTVVYDKTLKPRMIIEYKAPTVKITKEVFAQISRYNLILKVDYLIVSNGLQHYCCKMDYNNSTFTFLQEIPEYDKIIEML
jgi:hypothetical protein